MAKDITERRQLEDRLRRQARTDVLTDLPNRAALVEGLTEALDRPGVALLFIDLDRFKVVNDSLGHACGDRLLVAVAERIRSQLREGDLLARLGGDEFCLLVRDVDHPEIALGTASGWVEVGIPPRYGRQGSSRWSDA